MFEGSGLPAEKLVALQNELKAGFVDKATSLERIPSLLEALGDKSRASRLSPQTKQQRLSLRLFLLVKQHYFHTNDTSLVVALLENRLTENTPTSLFVSLMMNGNVS